LEWTCAIVTVEKMREMRKENERNFHEREWKFLLNLFTASFRDIKRDRER
jgi:hypothetical protein